MRAVRKVAFNVNGIREGDKWMALKAFMAECGAEICVLTETHLTKAEARGLVPPLTR